MAGASDRWGPWADAIDACERRARLRSLRTVAHCLFGEFHPLVGRLLEAESGEPEDLDAALLELNRTPARDMRKVVATFGRIKAPAPREGRCP